MPNPQSPEGARNDAVGVEVLGSDRILVAGQPEEEDRTDANLDQAIHGHVQGIDRELGDPGHRRDRASHAESVANKQRGNELRRVKPMLAHQSANGLRASPAPGPNGG